MKFHWRAIQLSILFHGIILLAAANIPMPHTRAQNFLMIDFSAENDLLLRDDIGNTPSFPAGLTEIDKNVHLPNTARHSHHKKADPIMVTEPSESQYHLQNPLQTPEMTINENNMGTEREFTVFSRHEAQDVISDVGFHEMGPSNVDSGRISDVTDTEKSRYFRAHFSYIKDLIYKQLVYPATAKKRGWEGKVVLSFIVSSGGDVRNIMVSKSSGHEVLDENAMRAVKRASPFPKPPVEAQIIIPVLYQLN
jgi:TonB family protein